MKKTLTFVLAATVALFLGSAAYANYCARDVVPSATLLVPYIAVGMTNGVPDDQKATTYFGITNVSMQAQIVHVTVWDVLSTPQIDFDIVLSGYDVWQINWRDFLRGRFDIFVDGTTTANPYDSHTDDPKFDDGAGGLYGSALPDEPFEWGPDGRDTYPSGGDGVLGEPEDRDVFNSGFNCDPNPPYGNLSGLSTMIIGKLSAWIGAKTHNGCQSYVVRSKYTGDWLSTLTADPLFFYATADTVYQCNGLFPTATDAKYFNIGAGEKYIAHNNVLIGDVAYVNPAGNKSEMMNAVHIESDAHGRQYLPTVPWGSGDPQKMTFYDVASGTNLDQREPLATAFAFRYKVEAGIITRAIVWKDTEELIQTTSAATTNKKVDDCGHYLYYAWDEDEHSKSRGIEGCSGCITYDVDPNEFPFETQEVAITTQNFDVFDATEAGGGWFLLVFPPSYDATWPTDPSPDFTARTTQAWVGVKLDYGTFSGGLEAATLGNRNCYAADVLPGLNTYDGTQTFTPPLKGMLP